MNLCDISLVIMANKKIKIEPMPEVILIVIRKYNKVNKHIIVRDNNW